MADDTLTTDATQRVQEYRIVPRDGFSATDLVGIFNGVGMRVWLTAENVKTLGELMRHLQKVEKEGQ